MSPARLNVWTLRWMTLRPAVEMGPDAIGDFVVDLGGGQHWLMAFDARLILGAMEDHPLASVELPVGGVVHSKAYWMANGRGE
jgi:hypothetical protein